MSETWQVEHEGEAPQTSLPPPGRGRRSGTVLGVALLLGAAAGGAYWYWLQQQVAPPPSVPVAVPAKAEAPAPTPGPSLADGDALLRKLLAQLVPSFPAAWLTESDLLRRAVAGTALVADGNSPAPLWGFLRPKAEFEVETRKKRVFTSPKSEARYDGLVRLVTQVDPAAAGNAYRAVQPFCQAAYAEIGPKGKSFDDLFRKALQVLVETPTVSGQVELHLKGAMYLYKDSALEALPPAQKLLIRTGPAHQRSLQSWLKAFAKACE